MHMINRRKIFYVPGTISLAFVPLLFIYFANKQQKEIPTSVISIFWADTNYLKKNNFYGRLYNIFPASRNYVEIKLTGNNKDDRAKLDFSRSRIREILAANDSTRGLHFIFMDGAEYRTFIKVLDILITEGATTYMCIDNSLWFYQVPFVSIKIPL
jgi:hypothetical protein